MQQGYNYDQNNDHQYDDYSYDDQYNQYNQEGNDYYMEQQNNGYSEVSNGKQFEVLPYNALFAQVNKNLKHANQMLFLPEGWCLLLLRQFKWDIDLLTQYFQNTQKYRNRIHYKQSYRNPNQIIKNYGMCQVCCLQNMELYQNICAHGFCQYCWKNHLQTSINGNNPFLKCMGCQCPILYQTMIYLLKNFYQDDRRLLDKYQKQICEMFSTIHKNYQFCTGADCNNCIKVYNLNIQTVKCSCGKSFCFKCNSDDHSPCSCEQKKLWVENVLKQQADAKWMAVNTKLCPWCKKAVQRSAGCNFMACVCGKNFCYLCSRPWQPDHKDHFKCHIYKKSATQSANREKEILQKMNHFTERYLDNHSTAIQNKQIDTFEKRKFLFKSLKIELSDSEFIDSAYKFSIECCQSLKWIYAYAYYAKWKNQYEKQTFEFNQGQFQKYKANLLKMLAIDLKNFLKKIQDIQKKESIDAKNQKDLTDQFKTLKGSIVNYYTMTKKYKQKFVEEIEKRDDELPIVMKKKSSTKPQTKQQKIENNSNNKVQTRAGKKKEENKSKNFFF